MAERDKILEMAEKLEYYPHECLQESKRTNGWPLNSKAGESN